ncbi:lipase secretion chaperone [Aquabacterium humicola]|uniref:lipase secretion chaperone n=1 Tax=Aquabacterium humicola TaxID=3237377 RepID=UPI002542F757|nr:lipase secretion chaperone [Rubrivivax pictus]
MPRRAVAIVATTAVVSVVGGASFFASQTTSEASTAVAIPAARASRASELAAVDGRPSSGTLAISGFSPAANPYAAGSLRGAEPDGELLATASGALKVSASVRRRFDHLLSTVGELSLPEITALIRRQAEAELPATAVQQLLDLWERYVKLQAYRFRSAVQLDDMATVMPALEERSRVRRELLGPEWAEAFFGDEERALREQVARASSGLLQEPASLPLLPAAARRPASTDDLQLVHQQRVATLGVEVAERLREVDRQQADWDRRLEQVRAVVEVLRRSPELADVARGAAIARHIELHFDASERLRARALLQLPPE